MLKTELCSFLFATSVLCMIACSNTDNATQDNINKSLSKTEAETYAQQLINEWKEKVRTDMEASYKNKEITIGDKTMRLAWTVFDEKPKDGYALYISLHGGGGISAEENDEQWYNQQWLYEPDNAVYLAPRAISDTWDLHFLPETDAFYHKIIMMTTVFLDVNPDKVYLMGYSAGGDAVWRLAPRLADHWAAAAMMAGHPGDVSLVNLRNTPFSIWCGAEDEDYDRNQRCAERIEEMKVMHDADPEGYIYDGHIVPGKGHWMDFEDAAAVPWMAQFQRNPYPKRIVWQQEEVLQNSFYWITAPANELQRGKKVIAEIIGNTIDISLCDYSKLTLSLCDQMLDLDKPVKVMFKGKTLFESMIERKLSTLRSTLYERNDPSYIFPAQIQILCAD